MTDAVAPDLFGALRRTTPARIGLGRRGDALPLAAQLDLLDAHARARDAVHGVVDWAALETALRPLPTLTVASRAPDRTSYLRRPDLGRRLREEDATGLDLHRDEWDLALVVADGLSAAAIDGHAAATVRAILAALPGRRLAPVVLARQARVAIGDEIGERLGAECVAVLIGERPGLTVADSLGIYVTHGPRIGRADSERNCVSNIHERGLSPNGAASLVATILSAARALGRTGVDLKIERTGMLPSS